MCSEHWGWPKNEVRCCHHSLMCFSIYHTSYFHPNMMDGLTHYLLIDQCPILILQWVIFINFVSDHTTHSLARKTRTAFHWEWASIYSYYSSFLISITNYASYIVRPQYLIRWYKYVYTNQTSFSKQTSSDRGVLTQYKNDVRHCREGYNGWSLDTWWIWSGIEAWELKVCKLLHFEQVWSIPCF